MIKQRSYLEQLDTTLAFVEQAILFDVAQHGFARRAQTAVGGFVHVFFKEILPDRLHIFLHLFQLFALGLRWN